VLHPVRADEFTVLGAKGEAQRLQVAEWAQVAVKDAQETYEGAVNGEV
jgi:hypothetical protein